MIIIPAIDIKGGKVVRLTQGEAKRETAYFDSPLEVAKMWVSCGASLIHIVDLDGAIEGEFKNLALIKEIANSVKAKIELGGGLRDEAIIKEVIDAGVEKIVLGTKALDEIFFSDMIKKFGKRIVVGIDAKDGFVYTKGWLSKSKLKATDLVNRAVRAGVKTINYTDISKDGMLEGPNIDSLKAILAAAKIDVVAAGGVSTIEDVKKLKALEPEGLKGMIIGKALYEKTIDLKEAIKICLQKE
jgi:phosphoribosylformimino-5-aminoimidazole carboxamide ribotide isomerase